MAKTIKMDKKYATQAGPLGSKEEQEALASEVIDTNARKMSEIIADKKEALKKNEDLLRALQTNEYDIPVGSAKLYKQIMKFLEKEADWGHTTATGLIMLYSNLKEQQPVTREKDWDGIIKLRGTSITIFWTMITSMKGKGFFTARDFVEMMAAFGSDLSQVVGKVHEDNKGLRENHARMAELDKEVNNPDVILDVPIDEYNEAEEELNKLMDEVDPVVETV
jgi:hypothetical protein